MNLKYLLDTNILSEPLKPVPAPRLLSRIKRNQGRMATAAPVWHELSFGALRLPEGKRRSAIERYLTEVVGLTLPVLPYDADSAGIHAEERARLAARGLIPPFVDGQIASIAIANNLVLVTADASGYRHFRKLKIQNWLV